MQTLTSAAISPRPSPVKVPPEDTKQDENAKPLSNRPETPKGCAVLENLTNASSNSPVNHRRQARLGCQSPIHKNTPRKQDKDRASIHLPAAATTALQKMGNKKQLREEIVQLAERIMDLEEKLFQERRSNRDLTKGNIESQREINRAQQKHQAREDELLHRINELEEELERVAVREWKKYSTYASVVPGDRY